MPYQIAIAWDNAGGLADMTKQPRTRGLSPGRRQQAGDRLIKEDGTLSTILEYGFLTIVEYTALQSEFGLTSVASAKVTIRLPRNLDRAFTNYNGVIEDISPPSTASFDRGLWINARFRVTGLETI